MTQQADFFRDLLPTVATGRREGETIQQAFDAFHKANPHVYRLLVRLARQSVNNGRRRISIKRLFEVLRENYSVHTTGEDFKLNNNFHSRYARLISENEPDLAGVFETRELKAA